MMPEKRFLIFLVALAIVIQNTCPYGWAAKTAFLSSPASSCCHCPMQKDRRPAKAGVRDDIKKDVSGSNALFVMQVSEPAATCQVLCSSDDIAPIKSSLAKTAYQEPPLRPPADSLSS
jgi:hypothetical protein